MHNKKFENIIKFDNSQRYEYLIRRVADFQKIYLIYSDYSQMFKVNINGIESILVFPEQEFAEMHISKKFEQRVREINLYQFIEWLDKDKSELIKIAVFPNENNDAKIVGSFELKKDLSEECEQYE